jgi:hypothetical protein
LAAWLKQQVVYSVDEIELFLVPAAVSSPLAQVEVSLPWVRAAVSSPQELKNDWKELVVDLLRAWAPQAGP